MDLKSEEKSELGDLWTQSQENPEKSSRKLKALNLLKGKGPYLVLGLSLILVVLPLASWFLTVISYVKPGGIPLVQEETTEYLPLERESPKGPVGVGNLQEGNRALDTLEEIQKATGLPNPTPAATPPEPAKESVPDKKDATGTGAPKKGALTWPVQGTMSSSYAQVYSPLFQDYRFHPGVDMVPRGDDRVRAAWGGRVSEIKDSKEYGWTIVIDHGEGWTTFYGHLKEVKVQTGQEVKADEILGRVGEPGLYEPGPPLHLHFELRGPQGTTNPIPYFKS